MTNEATNTNRVTLEQALAMPVSELATIPADQIKALMDDVAIIKAAAAKSSDMMHSVMEARYAEKATITRRAKGNDTGTVRLEDDGYTIITDLPKKVTWDDDGLKQVENQLAAMGEPVTDYIKIKREVSESSYKAWPASLQKLFTPHRTVSGGKATYKMEAKKE